MGKIKKAIEALIDFQVSKVLLSLHFEGYLKDSGWINSFKSQLPVNSQNEPLPWVTLPFIDFIEPKLTKKFTLFEFGSGNSTLYYSRFVNKVFALEHDRNWYNKYNTIHPENATLFYQDLKVDEEYCRFAKNSGNKYDIIIVDGRDRVNCILNSIEALNEGGILILDDSERLEYKRGIEFLELLAFKKIDFWGLAPGLKYKKCTTLFYKAGNCLGI